MAEKKKSSVRDTWIPETWRYRGAGFQKSKKKELPRKAKYKQKYQTQYLESKDVSETN